MLLEKPTKKNDFELFSLINICIARKQYIFMNHATRRIRERNVFQLEVLDLLENKKGRNRKKNKSKDKYELGYSDWSYCIEGNDIDQRKIRVIISFDDKLMLIITVVRLDLEES